MRHLPGGNETKFEILDPMSESTASIDLTHVRFHSESIEMNSNLPDGGYPHRVEA